MGAGREGGRPREGKREVVRRRRRRARHRARCAPPRPCTHLRTLAARPATAPRGRRDPPAPPNGEPGRRRDEREAGQRPGSGLGSGAGLFFCCWAGIWGEEWGEPARRCRPTKMKTSLHPAALLSHAAARSTAANLATGAVNRSAPERTASDGVAARHASSLNT